MERKFRICPGIGIARIGKSDEFFIGPESPFMPMRGDFKENGKIKKQGARFRVYEFEVDEFGNETVIREVTDSNNTRIEWNVQLRNKKAASRRIPVETTRLRNPGYEQDKLVIEGREQIAGRSKISEKIVGQIQFVRNNRLEGRDDVVLGHLQTDDAGRLIVIPGNGVSKSPLNLGIQDFANNPGWYDDCCDGPVEATLYIDGEVIEADKAWVVVGSPAYAPEIKNVVTWYDQAKDIEARIFDPSLNLKTPSFTDDIYPILRSASLLPWVSSMARAGHASGSGGAFSDPADLRMLADNSDVQKNTRLNVFNRLMEPGTAARGAQLRPPPPKNMPFLYSGVDPEDPSKYQYASLTSLQYTMMSKWAEGDFIADWTGSITEVEFDALPLEERPNALSRAALEGCVGGPFFPGIESTYIMALPETYEAPYRIDQTLHAGHLTELMAVPWQADFRDCGALWWPAQRPISVMTSSDFQDYSRGIRTHGDMVRYWNELGFVVSDGNAYVEKERGTI